MHSASGDPAFPSRVEAYVEEIFRTCTNHGSALLSVVVCGSAAIGGWSDTVSGVDLILVLPDATLQESKRRLRENVERLPKPQSSKRP